MFHYGSFLNAVITFASIAAAIFLFVVKPYEAYTAGANQGEEPSGPSDEERCHQELLAALCAR